MTYHFSSHGFLLGSDVRAMQSPEFGLLGNFVACEGKTTPVVKVRVKKRKGEDNFVTCMRKGLAKALEESKVKVDGVTYTASSSSSVCIGTEGNWHKAKSAQIGIGGVFKVVSGKIHGHVMPDFKKTVMVSTHWDWGYLATGGYTRAHLFAPVPVRSTARKWMNG